MEDCHCDLFRVRNLTHDRFPLREKGDVMKPQLLTILVCGLLLAPAQPSWARKWTDNSGKFSVEAELVAVKDDKVVLKKTSGSLKTLSVARLSETDRR